MKLDHIVHQSIIPAGTIDLRPLRQSDTGLISLHAADARVAMMTTTIPHPLPPGATEALIARAQDENRIEDVWAMDASRTGGPEVMGLISLMRVDAGQSEIGYWVAPQFWNGGAASAAVSALIYANPQNCRTIFACAFQDNLASARVLTNCGFQYLGDAESYSVARGVTVPTWTYSKGLV